MDGLKHPAEEAAERLSNGEGYDVSNLQRSGVKYVIHALTDGEVFDSDTINEQVHDDQSASVTADELEGIAEYLANGDATTADDEE